MKPALELRNRSGRAVTLGSILVGVAAVAAVVATAGPLWIAAGLAALTAVAALWHGKRAIEVAIDAETFSWRRRGSWERRPLTDVQQVSVSSRHGWYVHFPDRTVQLMLAGWHDQQGRRADEDLAAALRAIGGLDGQVTPSDPSLGHP